MVFDIWSTLRLILHNNSCLDVFLYFDRRISNENAYEKLISYTILGPAPLLFPRRETRPSSFGHTRTNIIYFFGRSFLSFSYYYYYLRRIQFYPTVYIERVLSFVSPSHWPYTGAWPCGKRACRNLLYYLKVPNKINIRLPLIAQQ